MGLSPTKLTDLASRLYAAAGLDEEKATVTAQLLVLTDMLGRSTHGLAQCDAYLKEITAGRMTCDGEPEVVADRGNTIVWDGGYRPGLWLIDRALRLALSRIDEHGVVTMAIRKSHHIGCLAALAKAATDRGCLVILASSGPHTKAAAPFGGKAALFSPNPFAVGIPTSRDPMLVDFTASLATVSAVREAVAGGTELERPWLLDHDGKPTRDPRVLEVAAERGSLMLLGGMEAGHKGFGLALIVEALTQGLSGHGRLDAPTRWGASVFLQLIDPHAFAGRDAFTAQMDFFADQCRASPAIDPDRPVRLPGDQAAKNIAKAKREGLALAPTTIASLRSWADRLRIDASALTSAVVALA